MTPKSSVVGLAVFGEVTYRYDVGHCEECGQPSAEFGEEERIGPRSWLHCSSVLFIVPLHLPFIAYMTATIQAEVVAYCAPRNGRIGVVNPTHDRKLILSILDKNIETPDCRNLRASRSSNSQGRNPCISIPSAGRSQKIRTYATDVHFSVSCEIRLAPDSEGGAGRR